MSISFATGDIMDVEEIRPNGWQFFIATGYVNGVPCRIVGHFATLYLYCSYEEKKKGRRPVGFTIVTEPLNEPQPLPEQQSQGSESQTLNV